MRAAFYCPLKPPDHPVPSGDRTMARLLIRALDGAGCEVTLASRLRSRTGDGDPIRQMRLRTLGERLADRCLRRAPPPDLWFTYHLYYKAPDWIGPRVCERLAIPYVVAEASHASKRAAGRWARGHAGVEAALRRADLVLGLNPADADGVRPLLRPDARYIEMDPFLDPPDFPDRGTARRTLAAAHQLPADRAWLLAVGMMREGDKLRSYRVLGDALRRLPAKGWHLLVAGDGPAREQVETALDGLPATLLGRRAAANLAAVYSACDLFVWPAVNEAYGMALLEAQAAGLPAVAGRTGGVPAVIADRRTGLLADPGDPAAFAEAVSALLGDPARRARMGAAARDKVARRHTLAAATRTLGAALDSLPRARAR